MRNLFSRMVAAVLAAPLLAMLAAPASAAETYLLTDGVENAAIPARVILKQNLPYGPDPAQLLDVYATPGVRNAPIILMVHGGAWMFGSKSADGVVTNKVMHWLPKGYIFVSIDYRMSAVNPRVLDEVDDVARALAFVQTRARQWGGDPTRVVLMGHSAGAHLVSMISSDASLAYARGAKPWKGTVALDSAAFNVLELMKNPHAGLYDRVFGAQPAYWVATSPYFRLTAAPLAPMLAVCSTQRIQSCPQARAYATKATGFGGSVRLLPVDLTHAEINETLGVPGAYTLAVDGFLRQIGLP